MPKIKIDQEKCIGCGMCQSLCPQVFKLGSNGKSKVINPNGKCNLQEAVDSCPAEAISFEE
jgi:ferredoxin